MRAIFALLAATMAHAALAQEAFTAASGVKVVAEYGPSGLPRDRAERSARFVLSAPGQAILVRHGFAALTQTKEPR